MERLQSEVTRYKNLQLKASKDCEKYKEERDSVFNEYRLIMSERDQVIKELDKLQTELEAAEARLKNTSSERVVASEELEALRQVSTRRTYRTNMTQLKLQHNGTRLSFLFLQNNNEQSVVSVVLCSQQLLSLA